MQKIAALLATVLAAAGVQAQSGPWGQCGGTGWTGATTCVAGYTCTYSNPYYSQCLPGSNSSSTTTKTSTTTSRSSTSSSSSRTSTTSTKTTTTTTKTSSTTAPAGTGVEIRTVQDPVYHLYLQNDSGTAVIGPESSAGYFTINGSIKLNGPNVYLNIANGTTSYRALTFDSAPTFTGWALEGDTIITSQSSSYGRQLNFLACQTSVSGEWQLYLQLGNDQPSGKTCANNISIHLPCLC
ncbi:hypothetical protein FRB90_005585 [Tulasnella sp. 427]|nr:hypothetical protein FRB90_005585 [Tulasnella sp. 427]